MRLPPVLVRPVEEDSAFLPPLLTRRLAQEESSVLSLRFSRGDVPPDASTRCTKTRRDWPRRRLVCEPRGKDGHVSIRGRAASAARDTLGCKGVDGEMWCIRSVGADRYTCAAKFNGARTDFSAAMVVVGPLEWKSMDSRGRLSRREERESYRSSAVCSSAQSRTRG